MYTSCVPVVHIGNTTCRICSTDDCTDVVESKNIVEFNNTVHISNAEERLDAPVVSKSDYFSRVMSSNDVDSSLFFFFFSFFFTRKVLCSFAYQHGTN